MKTIRAEIILIILFYLFILGCVVNTVPNFRQVLKERDANFHLYISNQSFSEPNVNVTAIIDGKIVAESSLKVNNQHYWEVYSIHLTEGKHVLYAKAENGTVLLNTSFDVSQERWAVLNYWGRGGIDKADGKLHGFKFDVLDKPPIFL